MSSKVVYRNSEWSAYADGSLYHRHEQYFVEQDSVTHMDWNGISYHFPLHIMGKCWGDPDTLLPAWESALRATGAEVDEDKVQMTRILAYHKQARHAAHNRDWERWIASGDADGVMVVDGRRKLFYRMSDYDIFTEWRKANPYRGAPQSP
jgi:hypothetical protein